MKNTESPTPVTSLLRRTGVGACAIAACFALPTTFADDADEGEDEDKGEVTISHVMKETHKGKEDTVLKRAIAGKSKDGELKQLLAYYLAMEKMEPPEGEIASWQKKTGAVTAALIDILAEKEGGHEALKKATNCKACHTDHKE